MYGIVLQLSVKLRDGYATANQRGPLSPNTNGIHFFCGCGCCYCWATCWGISAGGVGMRLRSNSSAWAIVSLASLSSSLALVYPISDKYGDDGSCPRMETE
jgi:hypothetical protein